MSWTTFLLHLTACIVGLVIGYNLSKFFGRNKIKNRTNFMESIKRLWRSSKLLLILLVISIHIAICSYRQRFYCTKMSETELFLELPNNVILNFKHCN